MTAAPTILYEVLQERGYVPQEAMQGTGDWFDAPTAEGAVRVVVPGDGEGAEVHVFDQRGVNLWSVKFSPSSPLAAVTAVLDTAEGN